MREITAFDRYLLMTSIHTRPAKEEREVESLLRRKESEVQKQAESYFARNSSFSLTSMFKRLSCFRFSLLAGESSRSEREAVWVSALLLAGIVGSVRTVGTPFLRLNER